MTRRARTNASSRPQVIPSDYTQALVASRSPLNRGAGDENFTHVGYQHATWQLPLTHSYSFTPSIDERAEKFFFTHYVFGEKGGAEIQSEIHSSSLIGTEIDKVLQTSIKAVGLAGYASFVSAPELMKQAQQHYVAAIKLTSAALGSPVEVKKDRTLLSVMILGLFEVITGRNTDSISAWRNHSLGCAALLRIRGKEQLATLSGRRMFVQVIFSLAIGCLTHNMELPSHLFELWQEAGRYFEPDSLVYRFPRIFMQFTNFHARVRQGKISELDSILTQALELDLAYETLMESVPPESGYEVIYADADPHIIFAGHYHVYGDWLSAQIWNGMRSCRILLNEMIRDVLLTGFNARPPRFMEQGYLEQMRRSTAALYQLQFDILATVPQHVGYVPMGSHRGSKSVRPDARKRVAHCGISRLGNSEPFILALRLSGGMLLTWPLFLAGSTDVATEHAKRWVMKILDSFCRVLGIQQAQVLANKIEHRMKLRAQHSEQLGSNATTDWMSPVKEVISQTS